MRVTSIEVEKWSIGRFFDLDMDIERSDDDGDLLNVPENDFSRERSMHVETYVLNNFSRFRIPADKMDLMAERLKKENWHRVTFRQPHLCSIEQVWQCLERDGYQTDYDGQTPAGLVFKRYVNEREFCGVQEAVIDALIGITPPGSYVTYIDSNDEEHGVWQIRYLRDADGTDSITEVMGRAVFPADEQYSFPLVVPNDGRKDPVLVCAQCQRFLIVEAGETATQEDQRP